MVGFERSYEDGQYVCKTKLPLTDVANTEKKVPIEWINAAHNGVEKPFIDYVLPDPGRAQAAQGGLLPASRS